MRLPLTTNYKRIISTIFFVTILLPLSQIYSQEPVTHLIEANIRLSICGDNVVEGQEECEPLLFENFSCSLLGYEGEEVVCDNSCSFDLTACIIPEPPPPPVIDDDIIEESVEKYVPKPRPTTTEYQYPFLEYFDLNRNGKIDSNEFIISIKLWGEYWRLYRTESEDIDTLRCDLNNDNKCDIVDLSILLYHSR